MLRGSFHPYGPVKAGLEAMAAGHAKEFAEHGITVNVVVPGGPADTPMVPESSGFRRSDLIPPGKMAPPIVWLCSGGGRQRHRQPLCRLEVGRDGAGCQGPGRIRGADRLAGPRPSPVWPGGTPKA